MTSPWMSVARRLSEAGSGDERDRGRFLVLDRDVAVQLQTQAERSRQWRLKIENLGIDSHTMMSLARPRRSHRHSYGRIARPRRPVCRRYWTPGAHRGRGKVRQMRCRAGAGDRAVGLSSAAAIHAQRRGAMRKYSAGISQPRCRPPRVPDPAAATTASTSAWPDVKVTVEMPETFWMPVSCPLVPVPARSCTSRLAL